MQSTRVASLTLAVATAIAMALLPGVPAAQAAGTDIVVLGGTGVVSDGVLSQLATCTSGSVTRISGANRYATAAAVSAAFLSPGIDVAYVATGEDFPDALAGGAAAGSDGGPVLLVRPTSVPAETAAELSRLDPKTIVVLGGPSVVSKAVATQLKEYAKTVIRRQGQDRYQTAVAVSAYAFPTADTVYIGTGANFPDALAGGPAAVVDSGPVLLVSRNSIPSAVRSELSRLDPSVIKVLGGTAVVTASVEAELRGYAATVTRLSGLDRYATAVAVSKDSFSPGVGTIFVATGQDFPDALAGGPMAGIQRGPILLLNRNSIPSTTRREIERLTGGKCGGGGGGDCTADSAPFGVGEMSVNLVDTSRGRSLATTIYYPATSNGSNAPVACGPFPLVIAGHGAAGNGRSAANLFRFLVNDGYVVVGPTFPTGFNFPALAGDVSFVLTEVLAMQSGGGPMGQLDGDNIGYIGTSMGAMIGYTLYMNCCADPRIDAVVPRAGVPPAGSYSYTNRPALLAINGDADEIMPWGEALAFYNSARAPKGFIRLAGVGHDLNVGADGILRDAPLGFFDYILKGDPNGIVAITQAVNNSPIASLQSDW